MSKTHTFAIEQLNLGTAGPIWLGLFTADPGATGSLTSEVNDVAYARQAIAFTVGVNPASNTGVLLYPAAALDILAISHWAVINSVTFGSGTIRYRGQFDEAIDVLAGQQARIEIAQVIITERTTLDG